MKRIREFLRIIAITIQHFVYVKLYGMDIDSSARISYGSILDKTNPKGLHIGKESYVASGAVILSHDYARSLRQDTYIGERCFIGVNAIIMPGIRIGDNVIIGSGAVVTKNIPNNCIAAGNPAKIIKTDIKTKRFGQLAE